MNDQIAKFNNHLQKGIKAVQERLEEMGAAGTANAEHVEKEIRSQIAALEDRAQKAKVSLEAARAEVVKWVDDPTNTVAIWKSKFDLARLTERADRATRHAEAAAHVAIASVEHAEKAMLHARLARAEAEAASTNKAA